MTYIGLVMNMRGLERALAAGIDEAGAVCVATDSFAMRNQGQTCEGSVTVAGQIVRAAIGAGRSAQVTIAAAFGCPFEGEVPEERVVAMAARLCEASPREIALADTIGVAVPAQVSRLVRRVRAVIGAIPVRVHLHNTRNTGIANAWAAVEAGARTLDAALGGIGAVPSLRMRRATSPPKIFFTCWRGRGLQRDTTCRARSNRRNGSRRP
ncbi:beta/alpha barrel domain-containing protein [Novosphingobium panipatense]|uniref:hypothetical protein n=1 Tax=Novosphingobium panipatense TaxID=428991 RepID=UPI00361895EE